MGQVAIIINDRAYRLACDEGEEDRLVELATYVKAKVEQLTSEIGHAGDERLMLMAALMIADELWDARATASEPEPVRRLKKVAAKIGAAVSDTGTRAEPPTTAEAADTAPKPRREGAA